MEISYQVFLFDILNVAINAGYIFFIYSRHSLSDTFLVLQDCVSKGKRITNGVPERFCDDPLVNQLNLMFYQICDIFSSSQKIIMINK